MVGITAAARHRTYDMGQAIIEDIWCGSVKFAAKVERTRHVLDEFKIELRSNRRIGKNNLYMYTLEFVSFCFVLRVLLTFFCIGK